MHVCQYQYLLILLATSISSNKQKTCKEQTKLTNNQTTFKGLGSKMHFNVFWTWAVENVASITIHLLRLRLYITMLICCVAGHYLSQNEKTL